MSDAVGLGIVAALVARAEGLPGGARERVLERAGALRAHYEARDARELRVALPDAASRTRDDEAWRALLDARRRARPPRRRTDGASAALVAEIRATAASTRAAEQVPEAAGPYNGAAVAARALAELAEIAPSYVGAYLAWLEDLAALTDLPDRRAVRRPQGR